MAMRVADEESAQAARAWQKVRLDVTVSSLSHRNYRLLEFEMLNFCLTLQTISLLKKPFSDF